MDINVNTPEQLKTVLKSTDDRLTGMEAREKDALSKLSGLAEVPDAVTTLRDEMARLKAENDQWIEKIKTLTISAQARGDWKTQETKEAKSYGIGKIVQLMLEARNGTRTAHADLVNLGCKSVRPVQGHDGWEDESGNRQLREGRVNKDILPIIGKAGLSALPLTGDNSVGAYYGSYLVPVEYRSDMVRAAADVSAMMGRVTRVPMRGITAYVPTTTDALTWTAQTNQDTDFTEDTITFSRATLTAIQYASWIAIAEAMDEDSLVDLGGLIATMYGESWGIKFDTLCLSDTTYGATATSGINASTMASGDTSFNDINSGYLHGMIEKLTTQTKRRGANYFMHVTNWDKLRLEKNAVGDYIYGPPMNGVEQRAWGYPVVITEGMPANSASAISTAGVAFGNPRYIYNGDRVGYEFRIFDQTQSAMESGQIFLRVRTRQAFVLALPSAWVELNTAAS